MAIPPDQKSSSANMPSPLLAMADSGLVIPAVCCLLGVIFIKLLTKLYHVRQEFRRLQRQGLPMPPHHLLFGHLPVVASIVRSLPNRAAHGYLADQIRTRYPDLDEAFYLDLWPFAPRMLMVISPQMMDQYSQDRYLPKHPTVSEFLKPLVGNHNLVRMEGSMWKQWRVNFNPGFSASQVVNLIPAIVDEVVIFRDLLRVQANKSGIFQLEELGLKLSFDIIGRVVMDHRFNSQRVDNSMVSAIRRQIDWSRFGVDPSPLAQMNFFVRWYSGTTLVR